MLAQLNKAVVAPGEAVPPLAILIVDDSQPDRDYLAWQLRNAMEASPAIVEAETAADALAILTKWPVDVVLIDYLLPDMNGLDLLRRIVTQAQGAAALFMSGQGSERIAAEAIKHGAHDYFVKQGVSGDQLKCSIRQAVDAARRNREERASFQRLDRTHRELDHFVRALSHDMKANFMLLDHSFRELRRSCGHAPLEGLTDGFSHVEACLRQSSRFLDDLVTLARTGQMSMEPARVELTRVLGEVLYEQRELIEECQAVVDVASDLPAVWCNEDRVKQVVTNLVRNALRHGCDQRQAAIRISRIEPRDGNDRFAWLSIHDNGSGIPVSSREEIFLPGRRLPDAHESGSGMGLAIVRKIVEHYGGQAFVDPRCAQGTAFVVTLPRSR
jgi:signal transduction histidine kinase